MAKYEQKLEFKNPAEKSMSFQDFLTRTSDVEKRLAGAMVIKRKDKDQKTLNLLKIYKKQLQKMRSSGSLVSNLKILQGIEQELVKYEKA